jgi:hypothetical protein
VGNAARAEELSPMEHECAASKLAVVASRNSEPRLQAKFDTA